MKVLKDYVVIFIYLFVAIFTFGHAYNDYPETYTSRFMGREMVHEYGVEHKSAGSMMSALVWPLYWSVRLQR